MTEFDPDRRTLLKTTGATMAASLLAGCGGDSGDGDGGDDGDGSGDGGSDDRSVEEIAAQWATGEASEAEHPGASNFGGQGDIEDKTGEGSIEITNGEKVDGNYVYGPAVVRIDSGTTVTWNWASGGHSVTPADYAGATVTSDYGTGESTQSDGTSHETTFESAGVALYYCQPHRSSDGQVGAVIVE